MKYLLTKSHFIFKLAQQFSQNPDLTGGFPRSSVCTNEQLGSHTQYCPSSVFAEALL